MNTNARGTVAYCAIGLVRSNVWRTMRLAYSLRPRHRSVLADGLVELAEVLADLVVVDRRAGPQQAGVLDDACGTSAASWSNAAARDHRR